MNLRVGLHQGSSSNPYLFDLIMDVLAEGVKEQAPWCMIKKKTECLNFCEEEREIRMQGEGLKRVEKFKYLGSVVSKDGEMDSEVTHRAMVYGAETWSMEKSQGRKFDVEEIKMLRWMCGVTTLDKIGNESIRGTVQVEKFSEKIISESCYPTNSPTRPFVPWVCGSASTARVCFRTSYINNPSNMKSH
ncbi:uncharacterized protein [Penaeus vannamei]|uniref:uncharacterized protein n=1 Tax=Penaeus vannamei TaxID=6689 RepID=UPI00387F4F07